MDGRGARGVFFTLVATRTEAVEIRMTAWTYFVCIHIWGTEEHRRHYFSRFMTRTRIERLETVEEDQVLNLDMNCQHISSPSCALCITWFG